MQEYFRESCFEYICVWVHAVKNENYEPLILRFHDVFIAHESFFFVKRKT